MQGRLVVAITVLALGLWPGVALGATVSVAPVADNEELFYVAGPGEANDVVASTNGATVTFQDPGAQIQAGNDCMPAGQHAATCSFNGFAPVNFELKGDDDEGRITGAMIRLAMAEGGLGRDRLVGGALADRFDGGLGADVLNGGGSVDTVFYTGRSDDLRVTLGDGSRNDGGPFDEPLRDLIKNTEGVITGDGDDLLVGNDAANDLFGGAGKDVVSGKGGADNLGGMDGPDRAVGGAGADLFPGGNGKDEASGGSGPDHFQGGSSANGPDVFRGGLGHDTAQYIFGPVRLVLDGLPNDGKCADPACTSSDEGDNLINTEELQATFGDDLLIGSGKNEEFHPSLGADTVRAKDGNDTVHLTIDGDVDDVNCGPGIDDILGTPDAFDMNKNCE